MKLIVFSFFVLFAADGESQIRPTMNIDYGALLVYDRFQEFQIGGGIQIKEKFTTSLNFRYSYYEFDMTPSLEVFKTGVLSASLGYRILNNKQVISPRIILDFGTPVFSNANYELYNNGFRITHVYDLGVDRYNRGLFFGKLKALCDIKIESVNLLIGGSYNIFVYNYSVLKSKYGPPEGDYEVIDTKSVTLDNFGVEVGLMYTFPEKKKMGE